MPPASITLRGASVVNQEAARQLRHVGAIVNGADHDVGEALGRPPVTFHSELATPSVPWGTSLRARRNS